MAAALFAGATGASPSPAPSAAAPTASAVLAGITSYWKNLRSYEVPVTLDGSVKVSFISVPVALNGTEYYRAPDRQALHLNQVPSLAKGFENTMTSMGSPETWPNTYDIELHGTQPHGGHTAYVMVGTPRRPGNVKTVTMYVNTKTYAIENVAFAYNNGASLTVEFSHHGNSPYHLPTSAKIQAKFPQYSGNANLHYGTYKINQPIPDSVFQSGE